MLVVSLAEDFFGCVVADAETICVLMSLVIYTYSNCNTCRQATRWLRARGLVFVEKPIRETPPSKPELRAMLQFQEGKVRHLFNVAGREYRALKLKERFATLNLEDALQLLSENGALVKRPFRLSERVGLVGFDEASWGDKL